MTKIFSKNTCEHKYIYIQLTKTPMLDSLTRRAHLNEVRAWVKNVDNKVKIIE